VTVTEHEAYNHTFPIVFSYTIPLLTPNPARGVLFEVGAGVFVQIRQRLFVVTAAHCMKQKAVIVDEKTFHIPPDPLVTIVNRGADWDIDIGFLEVQNDEKLRALRKSFCSSSHLSLSNLPKGGMLHIVGYPAGDINHQAKTVEIVKRGFGSQFQEQEGEYLLLPFPKKENWFHATEDGFEKATFHDTPKGFSGGGLWAFNPVPDGEMFVPEKHIKLVGIQSAWWIDRRLVKCVPILRWLQLIHEAYADLRGELEDKWPILRI
jgi:hypothetical protein